MAVRMFTGIGQSLLERATFPEDGAVGRSYGRTVA